MKKWHKFIITADLEALLDQPISTTFEEHEFDFGGFESNEHYESKETFFQAYFYGDRRAPNYDRFIAQHVETDQKILSLACGRSANELMLMERGFSVICSDLAFPGSYRLARQMFPQMEQWELDILAGPSEQRFDVVICLGLLYLFDNQQLEQFFTNVRSSLNETGYLILDSAGPPDNFLAYWVNEVYLKYEAKLIRLFRIRKYARPYIIVKKHVGYRRSDWEIIQAAQRCGLILTAQKDYDYSHEFERSRVLGRILNVLPFLRPGLGLLGRSTPYIRMFKLQRG